MASYAQKNLFFFCRKCGDHHKETHPLQGAEAASLPPQG